MATCKAYRCAIALTPSPRIILKLPFTSCSIRDYAPRVPNVRRGRAARGVIWPLWLWWDKLTGTATSDGRQVVCDSRAREEGAYLAQGIQEGISEALDLRRWPWEEQSRRGQSPSVLRPINHPFHTHLEQPRLSPDSRKWAERWGGNPPASCAVGIRLGRQKGLYGLMLKAWLGLDTGDRA